MNDQIIPVSFHGDTLALVDHEGSPFVAMRPVVENMGLNWKSQYDKIADRFDSTVVIITTVAEDGRQREMVCLPLRKFPAWLYSISPSKVKPELREKIVRYQEECDDVLWKYWTEGYVERGGAKRPSISQQLSAHGIRLRLLDKLEAERHPEKRAAIHQQLDHASRILGLDTPALDAIGHAEAAPPASALVEAFWDLVDVIGLEKLNHSRDSRLICIRMYDFQKQADKAGAKIPPLTDYYRALRGSASPRFVCIKPVNSALAGGTVRCWVFERVEVDAPAVPEE